MYHLFRTKGFDKSYKRILRSGGLKPRVVADLAEVVETLRKGQRLAADYKDHQLSGNMKSYRECHIRGDLLLVYQVKKEELVLVLIEIGSHSYLGL